MSKLPTANHEFRLRMVGKKDRLGGDYYATAATVPVLVDLSKAAILFFPDDSDEDTDEFYGELVIKLRQAPEERAGLKRQRERPGNANGQG